MAGKSNDQYHTYLVSSISKVGTVDKGTSHHIKGASSKPGKMGNVLNHRRMTVWTFNVLQ